MKFGIREFGATIATVLLMLMLMSCDSGGVAPKPEKADTAKDEVDEKAVLLAEGKAAWRPCAKCHCATDPRIKEDEDWIKLNEDTT